MVNHVYTYTMMYSCVGRGTVMTVPNVLRMWVLLFGIINLQLYYNFAQGKDISPPQWYTTGDAGD